MKKRIMALLIAAVIFIPSIDALALIEENGGMGTQLSFNSIISAQNGFVSEETDEEMGKIYCMTNNQSTYFRPNIEFSKDISITYHEGDYLYISFYWRARNGASPATYFNCTEGFEIWDTPSLSLGNVSSQSMNYGEWNKVEMVLPHGADRAWNNVRLQLQFGGRDEQSRSIDIAAPVCYYLGVANGTQSEVLNEFRIAHGMASTPVYTHLPLLNITTYAGGGSCEKIADYSFGGVYRFTNSTNAYYRPCLTFSKEKGVLYSKDDYFYVSFYWRAAASVSAATYFNRGAAMECWDTPSCSIATAQSMNYGKWNKAEFLIKSAANRDWSDMRLLLQFGGADTTARVIDVARIVCFYVGASDKNEAELLAEFKAQELSASQIDMLTLPDTDIFTEGGSYHNKAGYKKWLGEGTPEVLAQNLLRGNYAFVANSTYYWNNTSRAAMPKAARINSSGVMVVPASVINALFATSFESEFVSAAEISEQSGMETFVDVRGFMLISRDIEEYIDKSPAIENDIDDCNYRSYYDVSLAIGHITWDDITPLPEDWAKARSRYMQALTYCEGTQSTYGGHIAQSVAQAKTYAAKSDFSTETRLPFTDATLTTSMSYTRDIARAYYLLKISGGSASERDALRDCALAALDKLFKNYIGKNVSLDSNWFLNLITDPGMLTQTMAYLYDDIDTPTMQKYADVLYLRMGVPMVTTYYVPFKYSTYPSYSGDLLNAYCNYSNLLWRTSVIYQLSLLTENTARMNHCLKYLNQAFENVSRSGKSDVQMIRNGFYEDGSFVFHGMFAYNLGYGNSYIATLAELVWIGGGTAMDLKSVHGYDNVYGRVEKSFLPFIYQNTLMKIVQGRENPYGSGASAQSAVRAIMLIASEGGGAQREEIARLLKPVIDESYSVYKTSTSASTFGIFYYPALNSATESYLEYIHAMSAVLPSEYNYAYYNMDRFVHKRENYTFMLAMSSERIDKYEAINDNGYSDWYTADGMTYLLQDGAQYIQRWWQNVDKYAIPGTTVDSAERAVRSVTYGNEVFPDNAWAGGASDGNIGVAGMIYPTKASYKNSYVNAHKSYFMLDDRIVCLGSGISGGAGEVYTTVENYISYEKETSASTACGYVDAYVNADKADYAFDVKRTYENPAYVWLESNRGYVFLGDNTVSTERVKNNKRFAGNSTPNTASAMFPFYTIKIEHGANPENARYGYVLLPNKTRAETAAAAQNLGFEILAQNDSCHAIRLSDGTVMANVFTPGVFLCGFTFKDAVSVIIHPRDTGYEVSVCEPTQKKASVSLLTPEGGEKSVEVDENYGKTYSLKVYKTAISAFDGTNLAITSSAAQSATLVFALYENGRLKSAEPKRVSLCEGINNLDISSVAKSGGEIRIMLLNSFQTLRPLCAAYSR